LPGHQHAIATSLLANKCTPLACRFHNQRYHFVAEECPVVDPKKRSLSKNFEYIHLPFRNATGFLENVEVGGTGLRKLLAYIILR